MADIRHPREVFDLIGHDAAESAFEASRQRGRDLHHAWLLTGPRGGRQGHLCVSRGAATARRARRHRARGILGANPDYPVSRQIIARSHPDILVIERVGEDGKVRKVIPVDDARRLAEFFSKSPASAPHRVVIVDAADDLNINAANALLKTLEEPPERGILLMISHSPGRAAADHSALAAAGSRFQPLDIEAAADFVRAREDVTEEAALRLAKMAGGAPGRAPGRWPPARRSIWTMRPAPCWPTCSRVDEAMAVVPRRPVPGWRRAGASSTSSSTAWPNASTGFTVDRAGQGIWSRRSCWARAWETLQRLPREVEALNLDRTDALFTALEDLTAPGAARAA